MKTAAAAIQEMKNLPLEQQLALLKTLAPEDQEAITKMALKVTADMAWVPNPGPQTQAYFSEVDQLLFGGESGGGKCLAYTTLLPMPKGWTTMEVVQVGDQLLDESYNPCTVTAVSPIMRDHPCYRLEFSDGATIVADAEHRWETMTGDGNIAVRSTTDILTSPHLHRILMADSTRFITAVEPVESVPVKCVAVDSPSHLYLAGPTMIPTHNTDLGIAKALQRHKRSLILRRINKEVSYLVSRTEEIVGHKTGFNGQDDIWKFPDGRVVQYGGCQHPGDEIAYKGQPKDLIVFDEASGFLESQVRYIMGWLRTIDPNQKTQALFPTNPPDGPEGDWIIRWWGPWVDRNHPLYPCPYGKPLWFREQNDTIEWREEPWSWVNDQGITTRALSRTFIRARLKDNPDYARTDYASQLEALPEELKRRYAYGEFVTEGKDHEFQLIKSAWVRAAQDRWTPDGRKHLMTSMGCDVARGGPDESIIAKRHGFWIDDLIVKPGSETPDGPSLTSLIVVNRRDSAEIRIDIGGGWGGSPLDTLLGNEIRAKGVNPAAGSNARTSDASRLEFRNLRAEMWWKLREALDPDGPNPLALPKDQKLFADLVAPRWKLISGGILIESKDDIRKRLGRSPDRGDAVALTCMAPNNPVLHAGSMGLIGRPISTLPKQATMGYSTFKQRLPWRRQ